MEQEQLKPKKRVRKSENWVKNAKKMANVHGEERAKKDGTLVPARERKDINCKCVPECKTKFTEDEKANIFNQFYSLNTHTEQTLHLRGLISNTGGRNNVYTVCVNGITRVVCQAYFLAVHDLKESRLRKKVLNKDSNPADLRGKHQSHPKIHEDILDTIRQFLAGLESRVSHYSRMKNGQRKYLDSNLSIAALYRKYLLLHPQYAPNQEIQPPVTVKKHMFQKIFNYEFNLSFGYPRSEICETCESLNVRLKAMAVDGTGEEERMQILLQQQHHWIEAEKFYESMKKENLANLPPDEYCITMDYQKNLPLPVTNVSSEYFPSQLWLFNFGIHILRNELAHMFIYSEHFAKKGSNEVISCLKYYIEHVIPPEVRVLRIWMDNSFGQNKNRFLIAYLRSLIGTRFTEVYICFPVVGHSRTRCDKDFALIEIQKRKQDKMNFPSDWVKLVKGAKQNDPFTIVFVNHPLTDDLTDDGTPIVKVKDYKSAFNPLLRPASGIRRWRKLKMVNNSIFYSESTEGNLNTTKVKLLKRNRTLQHLRTAVATAFPAHVDYVPITATKKKNIKKLLEYVVVPEEKVFYDSLQLNQVAADLDDNVVEEEDQEFD